MRAAHPPQTMKSWRATRVVKLSETPTLQKAIITLDDLTKHLTSKEKSMEIISLEPPSREQFLHESHSQARAFTAVNWLNKNLQLGWPLDRVGKPCVKKIEISRALTAQPGMLHALRQD